MNDSQNLEVDRLAARRILLGLGIDPTPEQIEQVASVVAEHSRNYAAWAIDRAQQTILGRLEQRFGENIERRGEDWAMGYQFAESEVARMSHAEMIDITGERRAPSKGQILRSMLRKARSDSALVERQVAAS